MKKVFICTYATTPASTPKGTDCRLTGETALKDILNTIPSMISNVCILVETVV